MAEIYTEKWYASLVELTNSRPDLSAKVPKGVYKFAVELEGEKSSPYVPAGETKYFSLTFDDGLVTECKESAEKIPGKGLNFRITGPATVFEEIAAGILDPIEAGLGGSLKIRGDMRFLMQNADMANVIFEVYTQGNFTEWPAGKPPYCVSQVA